MGKPKVPTAPFKLKIPHIMLFLYSLHVVLHLFYSKKEKAKLESSWLKFWTTHFVRFSVVSELEPQSIKKCGEILEFTVSHFFD